MTASLPSGVPAARFSMMLSDAWEVLDFDPETRDRSIEQLVGRTLGEGGSLDQVRHWAVDNYRQLFSHAQTAGIFFGARFADEVGGRMLSASVVAAATALPRNAAGETLPPAAIARALAAADDDERTVDLPRLVQLPVGPSVRTRSQIMARRGPGAGTPAHDVVRYYTPVPEGDLMLVITFSTAVMGAAGAFAELFDSLAATARWAA